MNMYRVEMRVTGYVEVMVEAASKKAAEDQAGSALTGLFSLPIGNMSNKSAVAGRVARIEREKKE